ncbi:phage tail tape measure protein [Methylomonas koyamae]|uniref:Phage tail tape measure protein domain-containing protein n=1 Tax=Methylomonas koyamae TaxID=702114 RepID=A0A291IG02_9GAMM|nr:phage tail tape measure protein [Methylomonas koyamae]ATG89118.1 hypothetical protein MKLM6_0846 [Methylomonas koyamae]OAI24569.1 hypothetical protein A1356_15530 [Methylomonas koyamae]
MAELRRLAVETAKDTLQLPSEILQGEKAYARAGMKFEEIRDSIAEASRSATVMRATVEQIANMDFDLQSKFGLPASEMKNAHNMAYYHGNAGRFESKAMAELAPSYLNALKQVGIRGLGGWNFAGALTQSMMKSSVASQPSQAVTLIEQGLGHIAAYAKDLRGVGIDVRKYGPKGQFGVNGILNLADAMKSKGLNDIFRLEKAGIRDQEAKKFWLQLMADSGEIRKQMGIADQSSRNDLIGNDLAEIKNANFGKIMAAEIQVQKMTLSQAAANGTSAVGGIAGYLSENTDEVLKGGAALGGLALLGRFNRNRNARLAAVGASELAKAATQNVYVTNWPSSMMAAGDKIRNKLGNGGGASSTDMVVAESGKTGALSKAGKALGATAAAYSGWEMGQSIGNVARELIDATVRSVANDENATLGSALYDFLNNSKIDSQVQLKVSVDDNHVRVQGIKSSDPRTRLDVSSDLTMPNAW